MARFAQTWEIFSSPGDSKLTPDGSQDRTLGVELLGRNIASLNFKTERVGKTAVRVS